MNRWTAAPALVVALLGLAACSATAPAATSPASSTPTAPATAAPPPATTSAATGTRTTASPTAVTPPSGAPYPAAEVCAYLRAQIPTLTAIDSPVGREANLAANLFGFFGEHGIAPDGIQLDAATSAQCPDVRSQLLTLTGLSSLASM